MANLSALLGGGGLKKVTAFQESNPTANSNWSGSVDITSAGVTDTSKTMLNLLTPGSASTALGTGANQMAIRLASATSVEYYWPSNQSIDVLSFEVIEFN